MKKRNHFFEKLWRDFLDLPFGRRLIVIGAVLLLLFCFFPWLNSGVQQGNDIHQIRFNAFEKVAFFGVSLSAICFFALFLVFRETFYKRGMFMGIANSSIFIGLFVVALYTIVIATLVFQEFATIGRFDEVNHSFLGLAFVSAGIGLLGAIFSKDYAPKSAERKIFADPKEVDLSKIHLSPETHNSQLSLDEYEKS
jgi:magnesium-transporting ATPase (P-type)